MKHKAINEESIHLENQQIISSFLTSSNIDDEVYRNEFEKAYLSDYPFPVYLSKAKLLASIFIAIMTVIMFILPILKNDYSLAGTIIGFSSILVSFVFFFSVRNITYPNEEFSGLLIAFLVLTSIASYICLYQFKNKIIPHITAVDITSFANLRKLLGVSLLFAYIIALWATIYMTIAGRKRLSGTLAPIIGMTSLSLFIYLFDTYYSKYLTTTQYKPQLEAFILIIFPTGIIIFTSFMLYGLAVLIGGKQNKYRK